MCCRKRSSRGTQILTRRSQSALEFGYCHSGGSNGHLHILEYLVERKFDKYDEWACELRPVRPLDCLKYLHETAKAPWDSQAVSTRTRTTTPNVYNTSSTTTVLSHPVGDTNMENCPNHPHHQLNTQIHFKAHIFVRNIYTYILLNTPAIRSACVRILHFSSNELETNERFDVYHRG